jgi:hypothetical protein
VARLRRTRAHVVSLSIALVAVMACAFVALGACGNQYTTLASSDGASTPADASADAIRDGGQLAPSDAATDAPGADAGPACDPAKPFGAPTLVAGLNDPPLDALVRFSHDELTAYRGMNGDAGDEDIMALTRATVGAPFGPPVRIDGVSTPSNEGHPYVTFDGLELYFDRTLGTAMIYVASRASAGGAFADAAPLTVVNGASGNSRAPYLSTDKAVLFFFSDRGGNNTADIYESQQEGGAFGAGFAVAAVNSAATDQFPVSADGRTLYFASDRGGGRGKMDIYVAQRQSLSSAFAAPTSVSELNTSSDEVATWVSGDGCRLYILSDRNADAGVYQVWVAQKPL